MLLVSHFDCFGWCGSSFACNQIQGSPQTVYVVPTTTEPKECTINVNGGIILVAGDYRRVQLTARDRFGNKKRDGGDNFTAGIRVPESLGQAASLYVLQTPLAYNSR